MDGVSQPRAWRARWMVDELTVVQHTAGLQGIDKRGVGWAGLFLLSMLLL